MYDIDSKGYLDSIKLRDAICAMLPLFNAENNVKRIEFVLKDCIDQLDTNNDGKVSKGIAKLFVLFNFTYVSLNVLNICS